MLESRQPSYGVHMHTEEELTSNIELSCGVAGKLEMGGNYPVDFKGAPTMSYYRRL